MHRKLMFSRHQEHGYTIGTIIFQTCLKLQKEINEDGLYRHS